MLLDNRQHFTPLSLAPAEAQVLGVAISRRIGLKGQEDGLQIFITDEETDNSEEDGLVLWSGLRQLNGKQVILRVIELHTVGGGFGNYVHATK